MMMRRFVPRRNISQQNLAGRECFSSKNVHVQASGTLQYSDCHEECKRDNEARESGIHVKHVQKVNVKTGLHRARKNSGSLELVPAST
jgi:hypothetical protein